MNSRFVWFACLLSLSVGVNAQSPSGHSVDASNHSGQAIGHSAAAGVKTAASVVAVPLLAIGGVGVGALSLGAELSEFANEPLPLGDAVVGRAPTPSPRQMMDLDGKGVDQ